MLRERCTLQCPSHLRLSPNFLNTQGSLAINFGYYITSFNICVHRKSLLCYILLTNYGRLGAGCWPRCGLGTSDGTWIRARSMQMLSWTANQRDAGCIAHPSTKLTSSLVPGLFLLDPCTIASHLDTLRNRWIRHKPYYGGYNTIVNSWKTALSLDTNDVNHTIGGYNTIVS